VRCEGLKGSDRSGKSDPFVQVKFLRESFKTPVKKSTCDPVFSTGGDDGAGGASGSRARKDSDKSQFLFGAKSGLSGSGEWYNS